MTKKWLLYPPKPRVVTEFDNFFFGPSSITLGALEIPNTLKDSPVKITIKKATTEVKTTKSGGCVDKTLTTVTDLTAEFTIIYNTDRYNKLIEITGYDPNTDFGELLDVPVVIKNDETLTIFRANITFQVEINYKTDKISTIKIEVKALKDPNKGYYKIGGMI